MSQTRPFRRITSAARRLLPPRFKHVIAQHLPASLTNPNDAGAPQEPDSWATVPDSPWPLPSAETEGVRCNICHWQGAEFEGPMHCEGATCPHCGAIGRDRFLFFCMQRRVTPSLGCVVLETSPRMGPGYRSAMGRWFDYLCSDFDENRHKAMVRLDLQDIDLDDASIDLILTPHVLEHVPDTGRALREIHRVLRPGGTMLLQVPVLQGRTAPPATPEFHGDNTPVFWRFGYDLADVLADHGFEVQTLVTEEWADLAASGAARWDGDVSDEFDVASMLDGARDKDFRVVASRTESRRFAFEPAYMYLTWECRKSAD